jgi:alpha-amylase/alpha-mannosidase (GH57 family)
VDSVTADAIVIHGHMYQPPRADPRTGVVPYEPTAAPYHDWNLRITDECYRPNAFARILDGQGRIVRIVNNFERMSFNLGPTLAHWLDANAPDVAARIVQGDRVGATAIAQPFHHVIIPLADPRDARTEILWGIADFEYRFGRRPLGIWLPETGIDSATLELLADLGIVFTIVAPGQVHALPPVGAIGASHGVRLVVYDGPLSQQIAFGDVMNDTRTFVDHLSGGADGGTVTVATDMETFGHHHCGAERGVAHALFVVAPDRGISVGPLGALVQAATPVDVVDVYTSAWSCAHGLGRWQIDCGCSSDGPDEWNQRWRTPLRLALNLLRDHAVEVFERRGKEVFNDSWLARDAYGIVLADPSRWDDFVIAHVQPLVSESLADVLLRSQQSTLASFTSCAWFFADLARREIAIVMQEANRSAELLRSISEELPIEQALQILDGAHSNDPALPTGRDVWHWALGEAPVAAAGTIDGEDAVQTLIERLVAEAIAGDSAASVQAQAVIDLAVDRTDRVALDRAQNALYAARSDGSRPDLDALAGMLGFAV